MPIELTEGDKAIGRRNFMKAVAALPAVASMADRKPASDASLAKRSPSSTPPPRATPNSDPIARTRSTAHAGET